MSTDSTSAAPASATREIYVAGGCFWGVQKYVDQLHGVIETQAGYANGPATSPSYEDVCADSGHAETVRVVYDPDQVDVSFILENFLSVIDPVSVNRQGHDIGVQYRSGIYYVDEDDHLPIELALAVVQRHHREPLAVEVQPLQYFYPAEDYHQHYLDANPQAPCHIPAAAIAAASTARPQERFLRRNERLRALLSPLQYEIGLHGRTEVEGSGEHVETSEPGIYVDVATGQPLFSSDQKFDAGCGWPSFAAPIDSAAVTEVDDTSRGKVRREVRSASGDLHLGHVFEDGPEELGGRRYCINSAVLRFVPLAQMEQEGYGDLIASDAGSAGRTNGADHADRAEAH
ncbi:MAG: peptide-methionine (R)-S-oxide reductase MsrB [Actinomyces sp.]|jgi:peptide methionine sulfoxide reductase msrA/msrB|nr:peptide-methionine (R)-S-oxide reductase MsrB [Actinomyces sp.]MCI1642503.1 peptide-methionine (R)-S-oxide reductase MsrB [Actinomyces sp.]MCI1663064.1 peptide-methionine (R)-S-oxide reductase MsrB [Actinomyces sp.]MCI1691702.1 peptide-methionine (R)-S-oxide reductase MsrB [Actinomyces sp.]MCI1788631.1 peptide-methionine (R)-S-oxide reductase MsrB [Actinomyces sp.]MCI1829733.1 peptide-methionine (R)-S-oxide reductase MsrB [Actinomyces sp.]